MNSRVDFLAAAMPQANRLTAMSSQPSRSTRPRRICLPDVDTGRAVLANKWLSVGPHLVRLKALLAEAARSGTQ
jgi:hypothetical protein